jgi:hypothetical protein
MKMGTLSHGHSVDTPIRNINEVKFKAFFLHGL